MNFLVSDLEPVKPAVAKKGTFPCFGGQTGLVLFALFARTRTSSCSCCVDVKSMSQ
jgi:hypothetical protein